MRRRVLWMLCLLAVMPGTAKAQWFSDDEPKHNVRIAIPSLTAKQIQVGYDYRFGERRAVELSVGALPWNKLGGSFEIGDNVSSSYNYEGKVKMLYAHLQYRRYTCLFERRKLCPYFGFGLIYTHTWEDVDMFDGNDGWDIKWRNYRLRDNYFSPAICFGLRYVFDFGLTLEAQIGLSVALGQYRYHPMMAFLANHYATGGLRIGWAF